MPDRNGALVAIEPHSGRVLAMVGGYSYALSSFNRATQAERLKLIHGSLIYRDKRLEGFDAAAVVEVIEHLDPPRLSALERVLFEFARPQTVVLTTPNREYNVTWETLPAGQFRHSDHRFEWTRQEFQQWANRAGEQHPVHADRHRDGMGEPGEAHRAGVPVQQRDAEDPQHLAGEVEDVAEQVAW